MNKEQQIKYFKIPDVQGHFLNAFQWWLANMWNRDNPDIIRQAEKLAYTCGHLRTYKEYDLEIGLVSCDGFAFTSSGHPTHKIWNHKTPWVYDSRINRFILSQHEQRYFELVEHWLQIWKKGRCDWAFQLFMAYHYNRLPFNRNVEGLTNVKNIWDVRLREYQEPYIRKMMGLYKTVYSSRKHPYVKIANECDHHGNPHVYHDIMYFHEWTFKILMEYTVKRNIVCDVHKCEGAYEELNYEHGCGKPEACDRGKKHGDDRLRRDVLKQIHGISTWDDCNKLIMFHGKLMPRWMILGLSRTRREEWTEDCGSLTHTGHGEFWPPAHSGKPITTQVANNEETRLCARKLFTITEKMNKHVIWRLFMLGCLDLYYDNRGVERHFSDYNPDRVNFTRIRIACHEWLKAWRPDLIGGTK